MQTLKLVPWVLLGLILVASGPGRAMAFSDDELRLASRIDDILAEAWQSEDIVPSPVTEDDLFLRRLTLDIVGRIPSIQEQRQYRAEPAQSRRLQAINRLLQSSGYARHWANIWRHHFLPQADTPKFASMGPGFEEWLREALYREKPYNEFCAEMLTSPPPDRAGQQSPARSFISVASEPEALAGNTSRMLLGINLDCAQCHNHPHARWSQTQFWEFAAFFSTLDTSSTRPAFQLEVSSTNSTVEPKLFNDDELIWPAELRPDSARMLLSEWITSDSNPYFAKNAVNLVWAQMLGTGLVEPLDDLSDANPPLHPEILDLLSKAFIASNYDLKSTIRVIAMTNAYQRASAGNGRPGGTVIFAAMPVRGLSAEQIYDSLTMASGTPPLTQSAIDEERSAGRMQFIQLFHESRPALSQRSILQSLELMNGSLTKSLVGGKTVVVAAETPFLSTDERIELVFRAVLSRKPGEDELKVWRTQMAGGDSEARRRTLSDLFWVLVNSVEFGVNY